MKSTQLASFLIFLYFFPVPGNAANSTHASERTLQSLIDYALEHNADRFLAEAEAELQETISQNTAGTQSLPQVDLSASYQKHVYERSYDTGNGTTSNNGSNPTWGLSVGYDLQKLLGSEDVLAKQNAAQAKLLQKITRRDIVRRIKKAYYTLKQIDSQVVAHKKLNDFFDKIDDSLKKQKALGILNDLEREQFRIQKDLLEADIQASLGDREAAYQDLANAMKLNLIQAKERVALVSIELPLTYGHSEKLIANQLDKSMVENLSKDVELARTEYESYRESPLPSVFVRALWERPTMPSAEGPQQTTEIGVAFPLTAGLSRSQEKSRLNGQLKKSQAQFEKNLTEYRSQVDLNVAQMNRHLNQKKQLNALKDRTERLLDQAYLLYSQKRLDALGTLDIFQKYLQSAQLVRVNETQIKITDAELEYLLGGASL